jgi:predicted enzyme related to lactoylglutathione lyase
MADTMENQAAAIGKTFVWHELYSPSAEQAADFYTSVLGWTVQDYPMGDMGTYKMLVNNGTPVCGVMGTANSPGMEDIPPQWSTYIGVDDVDARLAKATAAGATIIVQPMDVPSVGRMALIKDPQGATVWFFKSATPG